MADKIVGMEVGDAARGVPVKYVDQLDGTWALKVATTGGGGGGGSSLSDVLLTDSNGILFVGRDSGATTGTIFTYYRLDTQAAYTPVGTIKAAGNNVVTVADGADVTQGAIADAAVAAGAAGTESAKLRAVSRDIGAVAAAVSDVTVAATSITALNANPSTGPATANSTVAVSLSGQNVVTANISVNTLGANITAQISYDGLNWVSLFAYVSVSGAPQQVTLSNTIATGTTGQFQWQVSGAKGFRLSANTATVSGTLTASLNASAAATPVVGTMAIAQIANAQPAMLSQIGGGVAAALGVFLGNAATIVDFSGASYAAATTTGVTISDAAGAVISYDINVTGLTLGSSTGIDLFVESSKDTGTTWELEYQLPAITATGHYSTPLLVMKGSRRRVRGVSRGAAATTCTVTGTVNRFSAPPPRTPVSFYDRTSTLLTNPAVGATTSGWINGTATAGAGYPTHGNGNIAADINLGTATNPATYQLQVCAFNSTNASDWANVGTATLAVQNASTRVSASGITEAFFRVICTVAGTSQAANYVALTAN